jgi:RNA polymerase sigma factor (sigma-70 family)
MRRNGGPDVPRDGNERAEMVTKIAWSVLKRMLSAYHRKLGLEDRKDIVQDAVLQVEGSFTTFRGEARWTTWAHTIVRRSIWANLKERWRQEETHGDESRFEDKGRREELDREVLVREVLSRLREACARLLTLFYLHGYSDEECRVELGAPTRASVKMRRHRCLSEAQQIVLGMEGVGDGR